MKLHTYALLNEYLLEKMIHPKNTWQAIDLSQDFSVHVCTFFFLFSFYIFFEFDF